MSSIDTIRVTWYLVHIEAVWQRRVLFKYVIDKTNQCGQVCSSYRSCVTVDFLNYVSDKHCQNDQVCSCSSYL